jgi:Putative adhesin
MHSALLAPTLQRAIGKYLSALPARSLVRLSVFLLVIFVCLPAFTYAAEGRKENQKSDSFRSGPRLKSDLRGEIPTQDGRRIHLVLDLGNIVIHTQNSGKVDYTVHLEADASQKDAKELLKSFSITAHETPEGVYFRGQTSRQSSGRLWVTVTVNVPKSYSLELSTGGGNIDSDDVDGTETVLTSGGNIKAGSVSGKARLVTGGGHITVKNVAGGLFANTGGGHITTGAVSSGATLHTSGGHIRMASVDGLAKLSTGGGNVTVEHSGSELNAETTGGQIEVGETTGLVRAKTGGGGIRVVRVSGPTDLETVGGSIYLTQVDSAVKASTGAGLITAWFVAPVKSPSQCQLQSNDGDIVVYIPRQLPVTIDAQVQSGDEHRVIVDPAFQLKMSYDAGSNGGHSVRAEGPLNGGGEILHLRTVAGNIRVVASDAGKQVQLYKQQMAQMEEQLRLQFQSLEQSRSRENSP